MKHYFDRFSLKMAYGLVLIALLLLGHTVMAQEIPIGQTLSLTGPSSAIAQDLLRGRQACVNAINADGGVRGHVFKLITRDDAGDPERALQMGRELLDREHIVALLGPMGPAINSAILDWATQSSLAVVGPQGGDIINRVRNRDTAFFLTANQSAEAERLATHIASLGLQRVVIVHATDEEGRAALTAFEEALSVSNIQWVADIPVRPDGQDAMATAQAVRKANAQAVLLATVGTSTIAMLQALSHGDNSSSTLFEIYGLSSAASKAELMKLGSGIRGFTMSQVLPFPQDPSLPVVATFLAALGGPSNERSYGELEGCMSVLMLADVLRRKTSEPSRATVLQALRSAGTVKLGGFDIDLGDRVHSGSHYTDIVFVRSGGRIVR